MRRLCFTLIIAFLAINLSAQISEFPYYEGFENQVFPPADWTGYAIVAGDKEFERVTEGEWPDCLPHDGSIAMAQYNCFNASAGEEAVLITPELLLTEENVLRFWFFRSEDPSNNRLDKIEVYYNSTPDLEGATFLDSINRAVNFYPVVAMEDWYQYSFEFDHPGTTYIIFKAISAYGWRMYLDDVEVATNSIDEDAPEVISLAGNAVYAQQEMNLTLRVRDASGMPETMAAELIIDGQSTDVTMTKTVGSKGDFIYEGVIAGKPNHTEGTIQFLLADELDNTAWSELYPVNWDWIQPLLEEGFEGETFPPAQWSVTGEPLTWLTWDDYGLVNYIDSDNVEWEVYPPEGERQAAVEWDFQNNVQDEWLITPAISITENAVLTFKTFARLVSVDYDEYRVKVSTNGFTWNTIWSANDYPAGVTDYSENITLNLSEYIGEEVYIAWQAYNTMGTNVWYSWFIDDVKVSATDTIVGISEVVAPVLSTVYPNPFNTSTKLWFQLHNESSVYLKIFGLKGDVVLEKFIALLSKGNHQIEIDGAALPKGFYFYKLETKEGSTTGKIIRE